MIEKWIAFCKSEVRVPFFQKNEYFYIYFFLILSFIFEYNVMKMKTKMKSKMNEKWMKKANCEQPYCLWRLQGGRD